MRESVRKGFSLCVPICVGVFAYAGIFGVLAAAKGVPASLVVLMGALVFSGSAQFVIVDMWGSASLWTVLGAVASMNLRYLLICASVEPLFAGKSLFQRMFRVHLVADENWAVAMAAQTGESEKADILLAGGIALMLSWLAGSLAGRFAGGWIPAPGRWAWWSRDSPGAGWAAQTAPARPGSPASSRAWVDPRQAGRARWRWRARPAAPHPAPPHRGPPGPARRRSRRAPNPPRGGRSRRWRRRAAARSDARDSRR